MMKSAPCFIHLGGSHDHHGVIIPRRFAVDQPLSTRGFIPTHHANGMQFVHGFRHGHQDWHGTEWFASKIRVKTRHEYTHTAFSLLLGNIDDFIIHELGLINSDDGCIFIDF